MGMKRSNFTYDWKDREHINNIINDIFDNKREFVILSDTEEDKAIKIEGWAENINIFMFHGCITSYIFNETPASRHPELVETFIRALLNIAGPMQQAPIGSVPAWYVALQALIPLMLEDDRKPEEIHDLIITMANNYLAASQQETSKVN